MQTYHITANNGSTISTYFSDKVQHCQLQARNVNYIHQLFHGRKKKLMFMLKCILDTSFYECLACVCVNVLHTIWNISN